VRTNTIVNACTAGAAVVAPRPKLSERSNGGA
jgi:hypothetical protein